MARAENMVSSMRANAVMAGVVSLSEHFPGFVALSDRPTPAVDYLYDSIIICSLDDRFAAINGLRDFMRLLITDILERRILPKGVDLPCKSLKDTRILTRIRSAIRKGITDPNEISQLASGWVASHNGIGADHYLSFMLRDRLPSWAESFVRSGVVQILRTIAALETAKYDWWHDLGTTILYFAHGYMVEEWAKTGPEIPCPYSSRLSGRGKDEAFSSLKGSQDLYEKMRWRYQEALFMRLAECIGDRAGRRPHRKPGIAYPTLNTGRVDE
jgi:hypothetical protein